MNNLNFISTILLFFFIIDFSFADENDDLSYVFNGSIMKKQQASKGVISAITSYEKNSPSPNTLTSNEISKCNLEARYFELGDGRQTNEWLISTPPKCSVNGVATHWIIRNVNGKLRVLASGRGKGVSIYDLKDNNLPSGGVKIRFNMYAPLPNDISSEVIKTTKMKCQHSLNWFISKNPAPSLNNDIATVSVVDSSIDPSIHGYVGQLPADAAKHSLSIKRQMLSNKSFRCSDYY